MGCLIFLVLAVLFLGGATWLTFGLFGFLLTLFIAGLIGALADAVIPGRLPGGILGAVLAGMLGGFVGNLLLNLVGLGGVGPRIAGVDIIPAFVGALVIVGIAEMLSRSSRTERYMR